MNSNSTFKAPKIKKIRVKKRKKKLKSPITKQIENLL